MFLRFCTTTRFKFIKPNYSTYLHNHFNSCHLSTVIRRFRNHYKYLIWMLKKLPLRLTTVEITFSTFRSLMPLWPYPLKYRINQVLKKTPPILKLTVFTKPGTVKQPHTRAPKKRSFSRPKKHH